MIFIYMLHWPLYLICLKRASYTAC